MKRLFLIIIFLSISLMGIRSQSSDIPTKDTRTSNPNVRQEYTYWCLYAALVSHKDSGMQCFYCGDYYEKFIRWNIDYYGELYASYGMRLHPCFFFDSYTNSYGDCWHSYACDTPYDFRNFGVFNFHIERYLAFYDVYYYGDGRRFIPEILSGEFCGSAICYSADMSHALVYCGYEQYNNDWLDPRTVFFIMDPLKGEKTVMSYYELQQSLAGNIYV